jgi:hypothetical protein
MTDQAQHYLGKRNVTQSKAFSERLEAAISRYHANALTTVQVLEELIQLAKDIHAARARGETSPMRKSRPMTRWPRARARGKSWANPHFE